MNLDERVGGRNLALGIYFKVYSSRVLAWNLARTMHAWVRPHMCSCSLRIVADTEAAAFPCPMRLFALPLSLCPVYPRFFAC